MAKFASYKEMGKKIAEEALDGFEYQGKTIREWVKIITEQEPCDEAISRKATLDKAISYPTDGWDMYTPLVVDAEDIEELPPVTPQPKTGYWYIDERPESNREIICSNCEQPIFKYHKMDFDYRPNYCPNCGAKMAESEVRNV